MTISFEMGSMATKDRYILLRDTVMPRPIAWVSTVDLEGHHNLAPFSFFNVMCADPPLLGFSVGPAHDNFEAAEFNKKDTLANVLATGQLVINLVPERLLDQMMLSSDPLPLEVDEFEHAGLTALPSTLVKPPRVASVPVAYECNLHQVIRLGSHHLVLAEVIYAHIMEEVYLGSVRGTHRVDLLGQEENRLLGRLDRANYTVLREIVMRLRKEAPGQS